MELRPESVHDHESVIFSCFSEDETLHEHRLPNHALILVCEGEINVSDGVTSLSAKRGEYLFLKRDCTVRIVKHSGGNAAYSAMSVRFKRPALRDYFKKLSSSSLPSGVKRLHEPAMKIDSDLYLDSLFASLRPFLDGGVEPSQEFLDAKSKEALECLLRIDKRFYPTLFDFNAAWKIDLKEFMEQYCTEDMSIEEFASYTGRSLATFKRDFNEIYSLPPQKWLIEKRLEKSVELLKSGHSVNDTYKAVGFRNRSHFVKQFTAKYGLSPSKVF